jgi:hypothetical protein
VFIPRRLPLPRGLRSRPRSRRLARATLAAALACALAPRPAPALISPPATLEGADAGLVELGGAAIAPDGSGGLVYTKLLGGVPHVFAVRYLDGRWSAPIRVDGDRPYDASSPRIAAGRDGELLVVWVTQMATVHDKIQRGLVAAALGSGASGFSPSVVVDPNVGDGAGVSPSLSRTAPGQAIVAYRVVTNDFTDPASIGTAVQLRPGDVMEDVRVARLSGAKWSKLGAINRNPLASMRPPTEASAPRVGAGIDGNAVVAWQEPDQTGTARIWLRRIFGTTLGPVLEASPTTWRGAPVTADADAFSLDVSDFELARVAVRVGGAPGSELGASSLFLNTLPTSFDKHGGALTGALPIATGGGVGAPGVSVTDQGSAEGDMLLGWVDGAAARLATVTNRGELSPLAPLGAPPQPGATVVTAVNPEGGGVAAWPALDAAGHAGVGVREDFPSGAAQAAILASADGGPVARLSIGRADSGDAIVAFQQGEPGRLELVADRVTVPPANFVLETPTGWVPPRGATIRWEPPPSAVGGVTYSVLLDGRAIARGLTRPSLLPSARLLGNGTRIVRVLATDALGQQVLSPALPLQVDARAPRASVAGVGRRRRDGTLPRRVVVRVRDPESGVAAGATRCSFGDGTRAVRGTRNCRHVYRRAGRYRIVVRSRDAVGNRMTRVIPVEVR